MLVRSDVCERPTGDWGAEGRSGRKLSQARFTKHHGRTNCLFPLARWAEFSGRSAGRVGVLNAQGALVADC